MPDLAERTLIIEANARAETELERRQSAKLFSYFPDCRPTCKAESPDKHDHQDPVTGAQLYCRALYPIHTGFFSDGAVHRERVLIAANRVGKTDAGCCEVTYHTTGVYPDWWVGKRFDAPVLVWIAGDTGKTVRDIIQAKLLGPRGSHGSGFIPAHRLLHTTAKSGIADAVEGIYVEHVSGGNSLIMLKSYDQRREAFQGTAIHVIWLDEEPPEDIYVECLLRTAKTSDFPGGSMMMTFTPLQGLTKLVQDYRKAVKEQREEADQAVRDGEEPESTEGAKMARRDGAASKSDAAPDDATPKPEETTDVVSKPRVSSHRPTARRQGSTRTARPKPKPSSGDAGQLLQSLAASKKRKPKGSRSKSKRAT